MNKGKNNQKKILVFITGLSGSGLGTAINALEDIGYYCIDNLPVPMIENAFQILENQPSERNQVGYAFGVRFLTKESVTDFLKIRDKLKDKVKTDQVFLTADDEIILTRYGSNRRRHPHVCSTKDLKEAIVFERNLVKGLLPFTDVVFNTSNYSPHFLCRVLENRYEYDIPPRSLYVSITSFGFKHGQHRPLDTLYDVRFLTNPYFVKEMKEKNGLDREVADFIAKDTASVEFLNRVEDFLSWLLPRYYQEGKHYFRIGIGCTGGQHRSVYIAENLYQRILAQKKRKY